MSKSCNGGGQLVSISAVYICLTVSESDVAMLSVGHVPISFEDRHYLAELARQKEKGFPRCLCSNCEPEKALDFVNAQHHATNSNFSDIISGSYTDNISHELCCVSLDAPIEPNLQSILTCPPSDKARTMPIM